MNTCQRRLASLFASLDSQHLLSALRRETRHGAFLERFAAFLDSYGHRETGSPLLVSQPTWKDSPQIVLGMLQGMARAEPTTRPDSVTWMTARDEVLAHPALRWPPLRGFILDLITQARRLSALREDTHFAMTLPMPVLRRTLLELGRRLAETGILESAEDVFHLRFDELVSSCVAQRASARTDASSWSGPAPHSSISRRCPGHNLAVTSWSRAHLAARGWPRVRCASCAIQQPSAHSVPERCWLLPTRTRPGRRSSPAPPRLSSIPGPRCRTRPSWRGSMAFPP